MKLSEAKAIFAKLLMAYPSAAARMPDVDATCAVYAEQLLDLDADHAANAIQRVIRTAKWFPSIAELRAATAEESAGGTKHAELAWGDVKDAISRYGIYQTPSFEDPLVAVAVSALGWQSICNSTNTEVIRAQFRGAYQAAQARLTEVGSAERLLASADTKRLRGLHADAPGSAHTLDSAHTLEEAVVALVGPECDGCGVRSCNGACEVLG